MTTKRWVSFENVAARLGATPDSVTRRTDGRGRPAQGIDRAGGVKSTEADERVRANVADAHDEHGEGKK